MDKLTHREGKMKITKNFYLILLISKDNKELSLTITLNKTVQRSLKHYT